MADPIGLAASVVGLVSFGLEVAKGIGPYIDGVKARKEELAAVSTSARRMQSLIDVLRNGMLGLSASNQAATSAVTSATKAFRGELGALAELLRDLHSFPAQKPGFQSSARQ